MSNCFLCGRAMRPGLRNLRRKVKTGEWERRGRRGSPPTSRNVHFGMRVVCARCARGIDRERMRAELLQYAELGAVVLILIAGLVARWLAK